MLGIKYKKATAVFQSYHTYGKQMEKVPEIGTLVCKMGKHKAYTDMLSETRWRQDGDRKDCHT